MRLLEERTTFRLQTNPVPNKTIESNTTTSEPRPGLTNCITTANAMKLRQKIAHPAIIIRKDSGNLKIKASFGGGRIWLAESSRMFTVGISIVFREVANRSQEKVFYSTGIK
jgi:hypothetical protein